MQLFPLAHTGTASPSKNAEAKGNVSPKAEDVQGGQPMEARHEVMDRSNTDREHAQASGTSKGYFADTFARLDPQQASDTIPEAPLEIADAKDADSKDGPKTNTTQAPDTESNLDKASAPDGPVMAADVPSEVVPPQKIAPKHSSVAAIILTESAARSALAAPVDNEVTRPATQAGIAQAAPAIVGSNTKSAEMQEQQALSRAAASGPAERVMAEKKTDPTVPAKTPEPRVQQSVSAATSATQSPPVGQTPTEACTPVSRHAHYEPTTETRGSNQPSHPNTPAQSTAANIQIKTAPRLAKPQKSIVVLAAGDDIFALSEGKPLISETAALTPENRVSFNSQSSLIAPAQNSRPELSATVARQIAEALHRAADRPIELTLNPIELGRVRMSLHASEAGMSVMIHAKRAETIDLMRRNISELNNEFAEMGYADVDFAFSSGNSDSQQNDQRSDHHEDGRTSDIQLSLDPLPQARTAPLSIASTGTDIRI